MFSPGALLYHRLASVNAIVARSRMRASRDFFARDALEVAVDLVGCELVAGRVTLRITETEAYRDGGDTANHCRFGKTERNAAMFGQPGHAYVYLCYGIHWMLNLVTDREGVGAAVLIRSAEVVAGHELVHVRRKVTAPLPPLAQARLVAGPGKVGQALGLDRTYDHHPVIVPGRLELHLTATRPALLSGPRVGIDYAAPEHRLAPWRFADAHSRAVTEPRTLSPLPPSVRALSPRTPSMGRRPRSG